MAWRRLPPGYQKELQAQNEDFAHSWLKDKDSLAKSKNFVHKLLRLSYIMQASNFDDQGKLQSENQQPPGVIF